MTNKPDSPENESEMFAEDTEETVSGAPGESPSVEAPEDLVEVERVESGADERQSDSGPDGSPEGDPGDTMTGAAGESSVEDAGGVSDKSADDDFNSELEEELNIEGLEDLVNEGLIQSNGEDGEEDDPPISRERERVTATPAMLPELREDKVKEAKNNIAMLLDISLPIVVELGRTRMFIEDILKLHVGSVIALDKVAGEPANIVVNDKVMAKGEVVVIDENFGIRITSLLNPVDRLKGLK